MTAVLEPSTEVELTWPAPRWAAEVTTNGDGGQAEICWERESETVAFTNDRVSPQPVRVSAWQCARIWPDGRNVHLDRDEAMIFVGNEAFTVGEARKLLEALSEVVTAVEDSEAGR